MKATFELTQEQVTSALNNGGLNFTLNGEVIQPIYECEKILYLDVEKQPTKILITEDNIDDVKEGDVVMWERFGDNEETSHMEDTIIGRHYLVYCNDLNGTITIIDNTNDTMSTDALDGAICYKIIK